MRHKKPKLEVKNPRLSPAIEISNEDERMIYLVGWPGYRTARGKSGLGYVETQAELAHMQGLMLRWLFTGKFRTHNPFYLAFMFIFGFLGGVAPLFAAVIESLFYGKSEILGFLIWAIPYIGISLAMFVNALIGFWDSGSATITGD
jgi:hypothetical protein